MKTKIAQSITQSVSTNDFTELKSMLSMQFTKLKFYLYKHINLEFEISLSFLIKIKQI